MEPAFALKFTQKIAILSYQIYIAAPLIFFNARKTRIPTRYVEVNTRGNLERSREARLRLKPGSHVRRKRKRKHKEVHTSNANASTVQYGSAIEYSKMVDEVDVLMLLFFLFLGLRRLKRRRLIQRNNKSRPKLYGFEKSFEKDNFFLSCHSTYRFEDQLLKLRQPKPFVFSIYF